MPMVPPIFGAGPARMVESPNKITTEDKEHTMILLLRILHGETIRVA